MVERARPGARVHGAHRDRIRVQVALVRFFKIAFRLCILQIHGH